MNLEILEDGCGWQPDWLCNADLVTLLLVVALLFLAVQTVGYILRRRNLRAGRMAEGS